MYLRWGPIRFIGEVMGAHLAPQDGQELHPYGYVLTLGYRAAFHHEFVGRLDTFSRGTDHSNEPREVLILGYTFWFNEALRLMTNYEWPLAEKGRQVFRLRLQFAVK